MTVTPNYFLPHLWPCPSPPSPPYSSQLHQVWRCGTRYRRRHGPLQRSLGAVQLAPIKARRGCGATRTQPLSFLLDEQGTCSVAPSSCGGFTMWCLLSSSCMWTVELELRHQPGQTGHLARVVFRTACSVDCGGRLERLSQKFTNFPLATCPLSTGHRPRRDHNNVSHGWHERQSH